MESKSLNSQKITSILNYWFGEGLDRNEGPTPTVSKKWFMSTVEDDSYITENFKEDLFKLEKGEYQDWLEDKDGKLAAIILCDQFSRNIFRKQAQAFAYDNIAIGIAKTISDEELLQYKFQEQTFIILPYEHSENIADQERALQIAQKMYENAATFDGVEFIYVPLIQFELKCNNIL